MTCVLQQYLTRKLIQMNTLTYLKNLSSDINIASVTPTSSFGVNRICRSIDFERAQVIVEYGPGGGVFTRYILDHMHDNATLIAIETNPNFARSLEEQVHDPRLRVVQDSAENVLNILNRFGLDHADYIISGIPFSLFSEKLKDRILDNTKQALGDTGKFLVYQFLLSMPRPKTDIKRKLSEHMRIVRKDFELRNVPPLRIYEAMNGLH